MKSRAKIRILCALAILGVVTSVAFFICSEAVPMSNFASVSKGMTEAEVREILGVPDLVRRDTLTKTTYFYGGFLRAKLCSMEVFFGEDSRVTGKFHDH